MTNCSCKDCKEKYQTNHEDDKKNNSLIFPIFVPIIILILFAILYLFLNRETKKNYPKRVHGLRQRIQQNQSSLFFDS